MNHLAPILKYLQSDNQQNVVKTNFDHTSGMARSGMASSGMTSSGMASIGMASSGMAAKFAALREKLEGRMSNKTKQSRKRRRDFLYGGRAF